MLSLRKMWSVEAKLSSTASVQMTGIPKSSFEVRATNCMKENKASLRRYTQRVRAIYKLVLWENGSSVLVQPTKCVVMKHFPWIFIPWVLDRCDIWRWVPSWSSWMRHLVSQNWTSINAEHAYGSVSYSMYFICQRLYWEQEGDKVQQGWLQYLRLQVQTDCKSRQIEVSFLDCEVHGQASIAKQKLKGSLWHHSLLEPSWNTK